MAEQSKDLLKQLLDNQFNVDDFTRQEVIQALWSGYGEIVRYYSLSLEQSVVIKHVKPPALANEVKHPRGWQGDISHQRKLKSYLVEDNFYQHYSNKCDESCRVAKLYNQQSSDNQTILVLEDLDQAGYFVRPEQLNLAQVKTVIAWLAHFHANFLATKGDGLWPVGCYWHFQTRQDEWQNMPESELKEAALAIDQKLSQAKFQTLVHGDAKLANFCFNYNGSQVAAVDFQYIGLGIGVKDLAYFLGSCLDEQQLFDNHQILLDDYFIKLKQAIIELSSEEQSKDSYLKNFQQLEAEWRNLYCFAWADFYRFLAGWSPEHYKINAYMQAQSQQALNIIKNDK